MKNKIFLFLIVVVLFLTACAPQSAPSLPTPLPTPIIAQKPTYTVQRGEVVKTLELRGRVSAVKQEDLFFGTDGIVEEALVSRGDMVDEGQVLAYLAQRESFDAAVADAKLALIKAQKTLASLTEAADLHSAEALEAMLKAQSKLQDAKNKRAGLDNPRADEITIAKAETNLKLAEVSLKEARKQWAEVDQMHITNPERVMALMTLSDAIQVHKQALAEYNWYTGHPTEEQISMSDAEVAVAEAEYQETVRRYELIKDGPDPYDIALAEATVSRAQVDLDKAQASLDNLTIIAPFKGQIISSTLTPGMKVSAFDAVLTLVDPQGLEITTLPTATEMAEISVGQATLVRLANSPGTELSGAVRYLPTQSSNGSSSGEVNDQSVRVSLDEDYSNLTLGEVATVIIELEKRENVLWISPAALRTFQNRDFVIIQDGEIQRRVDVRLGIKSQDRVEIVEGLSDGQVALAP